MSGDIDAKKLMAALEKIINASPADALALIAAPDGRTISEKLSSLPDDLKFSIGSITFGKDGTKIAMVNKSAAIELAARCLGMVTDRTVLEDARRPVPELDRANMTTREMYEAYCDLIGARY